MDGVVQSLAENREIHELFAIGGSCMSPSRYSRFLNPCFFASCDANSTIFGELSTAITLRAVLASSCAKRSFARAQISHG